MLKRKEFILGAAVGLVFAAAATAGGVIDWPGANAAESGRITASAGAAGLAFAPPQGAPLSFADIVGQVAPAVVQIEVETPVERSRGGMFAIPGLPGFGFQAPDTQQPGEGEDAPTAQGAGSGFFISADGFIVTNNHVVANATRIRVVLTDGRTLDAELVGRDENTDLAVIKVQGSRFNFVSFEEEAEPRVGDWVVAVGNPFGLGGTATAGIVSAKGRNIDEDEATRNYVDFLQIDAAINRGNSGGPTFDVYGRVIGVNSAIISPGLSGGSVGIGFAIPASIAKPITDRLIANGSIERGYIGVTISNLSDDVRSGLGLPEDAKGAYIVDVSPGGPAAAAGLQPGDIVVAVNGRAVETSTALTRLVADVPAGQEVRLDFHRDGRSRSVSVRAMRRPGQDELNGLNSQGSNETAVAPTPAGQAVAGLNVTGLTSAARRQFNIPETVNGLLVTGVAQGGDQRFRPGFVIMRVGNQPASSVEEFRDAVAAALRSGRNTIFLLVRTDQGNTPVVLDIPRANGEK